MRKDWKHIQKGIEGVSYKDKFINSCGQILKYNYNKGTHNISHGSRQKNGYLVERINGKNYYVHRIVWRNFVGEIAKEMEIDHINSDRSDNRLENLRLVTRQENLEDTVRYKKLSKAKKKKSYVVIKGERIEKFSQKDLCNYVNKNYRLNLKCVSAWWSQGIPNKIKDSITDIGFVDDSKKEWL